MNRVWLCPESKDSLSEDVSSNEVQGCQLGERISDEVVNRAQCCLTSVKISDRNFEEQRGLSHREQLKAIAQDNENGGGIPVKLGSNAGREETARPVKRERVTRLELSIDLQEPRKARSNRFDRQAVRLR